MNNKLNLNTFIGFNMSSTKDFLLFAIIFFIGLLFINCSSSSGSLRYASTNDNENSTETIQERYSADNNSAIDDTVDFINEDVPESEDPSDLPEDEAEIDLTNLLKKIKEESPDTKEGSSISTKKELMIMEIIKYMNTPYKYGGNSLNGIDCSAFTQNVYKDSWLISINRSARDQYQQGIVIADRTELEFGDLVFFNTRRRVRPGHVGIYIGENLFVHASSHSGVTISSLEHDYYNKRYMGARRIDESEE